MAYLGKDSPMRISYVMNDFQIGGAQLLAQRLACGMKERGHDVDMTAVCGGGVLEKTFQEAQIQTEIFHGVASLPLIHKPKWPKPGVFNALARRFKTSRTDIVHSHLFLGNLFGRVSANKAKVPVVLATEHSTYFGKSFLAKWIDRYLAGKCDSIVCVSDSVREFTSAQEDIPRAKFTVIPNGLDLSVWTPKPENRVQRERWGIAPDAFVFGCAGRMIPEKNLSSLLSLFFKLFDKHKHLHLVLIGDGLERGKLEQQSRFMKIQDRVIFLGEQKDMPSLYPMMDAFVLPSLREGFGLVVIEAMAMGLPVLSNDLPAIREIIKDGKNGLIADIRNNPIEFSICLESLVTDAVLRKKLSEAGRKRVEEKFDLQRMIDDYERLYRKLLREKNKSHEPTRV